MTRRHANRFATWLNRDGYEVDTATSGEEALEKSRQREYAIYFVDLEMAEGMDGLEASGRIGCEHPKPPWSWLRRSPRWKEPLPP